jgi:mono/diheme cytochrome c family protein
LATLAVVGATGGSNTNAGDPSPADSRTDELPVAPPDDDPRLYNPYQRPKNGPPLTSVVHKVHLSWLQTKLREPKHHPSARMPDFKFTDDEVLDVMAYLKSIAGPPPEPAIAWPAWAEKGFDDMEDAELEAMFALSEHGQGVWGTARCTICHNVNGPEEGLIGGFVDLRVGGMDLQIAAVKLKRDWLYRWIKNPRDHFPDALMPRFRFSEEDLKGLVEYILREAPFLPLPEEEELEDEAEEEPAPQPSWEALDEPQRVANGKRLIEVSRCVVCHDIQGIAEVIGLPERHTPPPGDSVEFLVYDRRCLSCHTIEGRGGTYAPDLTGVGSRLHEEWLAAFLEKVDIIRPLSQQMPNLNLTSDEAKTLASYLSKNRRDPRIDDDIPDPVPINTAQPATEEETKKEIEDGRRVFEARGCLACHIVSEESAGNVGPELTAVADRLKPGYLRYHLKNPHYVNAYSAEPDLGLSDEEARVLAAYLSTKKKP